MVERSGTMATRMIDGIDVEGLQRLATMMGQQPDMAKFRFRATNRWINGTHNQAFIQGFYGAGAEQRTETAPMVVDEDEPAMLMGGDTGPNPVEYVLIGLSGCLTTSLVANAAARGIELRSVQSDLEGDLDLRGFLGLDPSVRNGYQGIRVTFKIDADAPDGVLAELVQTAQARSPVYDIVTHGVPVAVGFERLQPEASLQPALQPGRHA
jgi:uncharacterized OsmC-like protein